MMRFMGRHRGGGWRHHFGGGGFPGGGFDGMMAARKLASGDLQLVILALLAEQPRHGYDIIKELEERSKGFYVPSPGMVYPALTYLEEAGYATVDAAGAKKLYAITETGRAHLAEHRESAAAILSQLDVIGRKMQAARDFFSAEDDASPDLHDARHELRHALREKRHASPDERARVAEILRRAASEIRGKR
jgi:DNA-binding PadR family transcriptional regulator